MKHILIVDDDKVGRILLETMLKGSGYEVIAAVNGKDALEKALLSKPDMIISDILMPEMDGFQLCREVKTNEELKEIPFIFYTASYTDKKDEEFALSLGAEKIIVKPQEPDVFIEIIASIAARDSHTAPAAMPADDSEYLRVHNERLVRQLEKKALNLEDANKRLKELDKMKSEFIDIISHEIRTPLTAIMGYLEMIDVGRFGELDKRLHDRIKIMRASANRLKDIADACQTSSLLKGAFELRKKEISPLRLTNDIVEQMKPLWAAKNQTISIDTYPEEIPDISADEVEIWTVMGNILSNAIRYAPDGGRTIIRIDDLGDEIEFSISDMGDGIPEEHIDKIFDQFYIVPDKSEYARMDGRMGLGLHIAKEIIEKHGGRIWCESVYGIGSTFHFTLPKVVQ